MKEIGLGGIAYMELLHQGEESWYFSLDRHSGDLYEAEEIYGDKKHLDGSDLFLVRYPGGEVHRPLPRRENCALGSPVWDAGKIGLLEVDFEAQEILVWRFDPADCETSLAARLPLSDVKDCYNLMLRTAPLTLVREDAKLFEILWPERISFAVEPNESVYLRAGDKLYCSRWFEDPDYRVETFVRDLQGNVLERMPGDVIAMPDGELWHLN